MILLFVAAHLPLESYHSFCYSEVFQYVGQRFFNGQRLGAIVAILLMVSYWELVIVFVAAEPPGSSAWPTLLGRLMLPRKNEGWSLTSLQQPSIKTGGLQCINTSNPPRRVFGSMVRRIAALPAGGW